MDTFFQIQFMASSAGPVRYVPILPDKPRRELVRPDRRLLVAVDFDGVLHSYVTHDYPFNPAKLLDPPVPGMMAWLIGMVRDSRFNVAIVSSRSGHPGGIAAMSE